MMVGYAFERTKTFRALASIACYPHQGDVAAKLWGLDLGPVDWEALAEAASRHRLVPPLLQATAGAGGLVPPAVREWLVRRHRSGTQRALAQAPVIRKLMDGFGKAGIRALLLKGIGLSQQLYGRLDSRMAGDIDILVEPAGYRDAYRITLDQGNVPRSHITTGPDKGKDTHDDERHHEDIFLSADGTLVLELHRRLLPNRFALGRSFEELWEARQPVPIAGREVPVLGDAHLTPYLVIHGVCHGWERLRWLADVAILAGDGAGVRDPLVLHALSLSNRWFGWRLAEGATVAAKSSTRVALLDSLVLGGYTDDSEATGLAGHRSRPFEYYRSRACRYLARQCLGSGIAYRLHELRLGTGSLLQRLNS